MAKATKSTTTAVVPAKRNAVGAVGDWRAVLANSQKRAVAQAVNTSDNRWIKTQGGRFSYRDLIMDSIDCIILDKTIEHAYYPEAFDADNPTSPSCFAITFDPDDIRPHEKSPSPEHETCAGCPQFEWGSAAQGRGKACKDVRRIALLSLPDTLTPGSIASAEMAFVRIPVLSVKGIDQYFAHLAGQGAATWMYASRLRIVPDPKSQFRITAELAEPRAKPLPEKLYDAIAKRISEAEAELERPYEPREEEAPAPKKGRGKPTGRSAPSKRKY